MKRIDQWFLIPVKEVYYWPRLSLSYPLTWYISHRTILSCKEISAKHPTTQVSPAYLRRSQVIQTVPGEDELEQTMATPQGSKALISTRNLRRIHEARDEHNKMTAHSCMVSYFTPQHPCMYIHKHIMYNSAWYSMYKICIYTCTQKHWGFEFHCSKLCTLHYSFYPRKPTSSCLRWLEMLRRSQCRCAPPKSERDGGMEGMEGKAQ